MNYSPAKTTAAIFIFCAVFPGSVFSQVPADGLMFSEIDRDLNLTISGNGAGAALTALGPPLPFAAANVGVAGVGQHISANSGSAVSGGASATASSFAELAWHGGTGDFALTTYAVRNMSVLTGSALVDCESVRPNLGGFSTRSFEVIRSRTAGDLPSLAGQWEITISGSVLSGSTLGLSTFNHTETFLVNGVQVGTIGYAGGNRSHPLQE